MLIMVPWYFIAGGWRIIRAFGDGVEGLEYAREIVVEIEREGRMRALGVLEKREGDELVHAWIVGENGAGVGRENCGLVVRVCGCMRMSLQCFCVPCRWSNTV